MSLQVMSQNSVDTEMLGEHVGRLLEAGDIVCLYGELGSGKTTFVRGAARALGITGPVTSPTYTVGHRYGGDVDVSHLDLYRFQELSAEDWGNLEAYFEDAVVFVEWPEAGSGWLPAARASVRLRHLGDVHRLVLLQSPEKPLEIRLTSGADPRV